MTDNTTIRFGGVASATPDNYLSSLRAALRVKFSEVTDMRQLGRLVPLRRSIRDAFDFHQPESVIRWIIYDTDVSDDSVLEQIKTEALNLSEWTVTDPVYP